MAIGSGEYVCFERAAYTIATLAGGVPPPTPLPALKASIYPNAGIAVDRAGNLFIAEFDSDRVRKISGGAITTIAGSGSSGYDGDGGSGIGAKLWGPARLAAGSDGAVYVSEALNNAVRVLRAK